MELKNKQTKLKETAHKAFNEQKRLAPPEGWALSKVVAKGWSVTSHEKWSTMAGDNKN